MKRELFEVDDVIENPEPISIHDQQRYYLTALIFVRKHFTNKFDIINGIEIQLDELFKQLKKSPSNSVCLKIKAQVELAEKLFKGIPDFIEYMKDPWPQAVDEEYMRRYVHQNTNINQIKTTFLGYCAIVKFRFLSKLDECMHAIYSIEAATKEIEANLTATNQQTLSLEETMMPNILSVVSILVSQLRIVLTNEGYDEKEIQKFVDTTSATFSKQMYADEKGSKAVQKLEAVRNSYMEVAHQHELQNDAIANIPVIAQLRAQTQQLIKENKSIRKELSESGQKEGDKSLDAEGSLGLSSFFSSPQ